MWAVCSMGVFVVCSRLQYREVRCMLYGLFVQWGCSLCVADCCMERFVIWTVCCMGVFVVLS